MKILSLLIKKKCYSLASRRGSRFDIYCSVFFDLRKETLKMRLVTIKKGVKLLMTKKSKILASTGRSYDFVFFPLFWYIIIIKLNEEFVHQMCVHKERITPNNRDS